jgi:hypothetical protein
MSSFTGYICSGLPCSVLSHTHHLETPVNAFMPRNIKLNDAMSVASAMLQIKSNADAPPVSWPRIPDAFDGNLQVDFVKVQGLRPCLVVTQRAESHLAASVGLLEMVAARAAVSAFIWALMACRL